MARPRVTDGTPVGRLTFVVDLLALAVFVLAGMRSHRTTSQLEIFLRNAVPLGGAWLLASVVVRTYRPPTLSRLLITWVIAIPAAVMLRSAWTGSPDGRELAVFGAVAMTFTLAFLGAGRVVTTVLASRLRAPTSR